MGRAEEAAQSLLGGRRFAHVQDMDAGATSLSFRLGIGMRLLGPGAAAAAAARRLEERIGASEGIASIRRWLLIIGAGAAETQPPDALQHMCGSAEVLCMASAHGHAAEE